MHTPAGELLSVTEIADRLHVRPHVVTYVIRTRSIRPSRWVGHARLFSEAAVSRIANELASQQASDRDSHLASTEDDCVAVG
jgi:hypothetical protein